ncbi:hypothetical protein [uncultured Parabacteroides sp.]|uniref:hypothetical protein n=1 Tax=uncultured Parabacteroides sp. TaxID=512312 RepID=UPI002658D86E|nr:hypothetical protein [uncultured Parabacteroides sp.]
MNKTIICILGFLLLVGCQSQSFEQAVKNSFDNYLDTTVVDYKYVMLIPNSGCTGCISDAEYFFKEYNDKSEILFIFTHIISKKDLRIRVGKENLQRKNVLIDIENRFYFEQFQESIYPIVAVIKDKEVVALKDHVFLREKYPPKD